MGHFWASYSLLVWYGIPVHVAVKLICLTIGLWIFLSKDNVLLVLQYDTGGVHQFYPGKSDFPHICLWYLYIYIYIYASLIWGVHLPLVSVSLYMHWYFLIFSYWTVKRLLCSMVVLARGSICLWYLHVYALVFPYIFLLVDCFEWALIGDIEKHRGHSVLWQFRMGGQSSDLP